MLSHPFCCKLICAACCDFIISCHLRLCEAPPLEKTPPDAVALDNLQAPQLFSLLCSLQHCDALQLGGALPAAQAHHVSLSPGRPSGGAGWGGVGVDGGRWREAGHRPPPPPRARHGPTEGKGSQREQGAARRDDPVGSCSNVSLGQQLHPHLIPARRDTLVQEDRGM